MRKTSCAFFLLATSLAFGQSGLLHSGPMVAYSEMTETAIWVQTTQAAKVSIRYWQTSPVEKVNDATPPSGTGKTREILTNEDEDFATVVKITNLPFGQKFGYEVLINGKPVKLKYPTTFQTQPHYLWAKNPRETPDLTVAFGSCSNIPEAYFDRPGKPYGGQLEIFQAIADKKPDMMLWLGDNLYFREPDWFSESGMRYRWKKDRSVQELQSLLGSTHHYATWDDHDFGPNDSDSSYKLKDTALALHKRYWPAVRYGWENVPGVFQNFQWGDVEFFMLDDRYHRSPNKWSNLEDKHMLGPAQLHWLKMALRSSNATYKIVVNGGQMLNKNSFECWANFPAERQDFLNFVSKEKIGGLVFLSGDRHSAELLQLDVRDMYTFFEFTSSPLTAGPSSGAKPDPLGAANTLYKERNFGMLKFEGNHPRRKLTMSLHDVAGKEIWKIAVMSGDLQAP